MGLTGARVEAPTMDRLLELPELELPDFRTVFALCNSLEKPFGLSSGAPEPPGVGVDMLSLCNRVEWYKSLGAQLISGAAPKEYRDLECPDCCATL